MVELINQDYEHNKALYYNLERELQSKLGNVIIDHVGSTAIPHIFGKNIIDILIGVNSEDFDRVRAILIDMGYCPSERSRTDIYQFFASTIDETKSGDTHIHLVELGTDRYNEFIVLRDYLLDNPSEAIAYSNHKKEILSANLSRQEYREIKSKYVSALIDRAKNKTH